MKFEKGRTKTGGRAPGVVNKNTELKNKLRDFAIEDFDTFLDAFSRLSPRDKVDAYLKVLKFVLPTISSVQFDNEQQSSTPAIDLLLAAQKSK